MKTKAKHPMAQFREICGLTQPKLAKLVGCSWRTIVSIENNQRDLSGDLGKRLLIETGVLPRSLESGWTPPNTPKNLAGEPYSLEFFNWWRDFGKTRKPGLEAEISALHADMIEKVALHMRWMASASANRNRLMSFFYLFQEWFDQTTNALALADEIGTIAEEQATERFDAKPVMYMNGYGALHFYGRKEFELQEYRARKSQRKVKSTVTPVPETILKIKRNAKA